MKLQEISKPKTAAQLNETLAKTFGQKIDLEAFTLEQLQDARNKVRTSLRDIETTESFDATIRNEDYQRNKMYLDVLNAALNERNHISERASKFRPKTQDFGLGNALSKGQQWVDDNVVTPGMKFAKKTAGRIGRGFDNTVDAADDAIDRYRTKQMQPEKKFKVRAKTSGQQAGKRVKNMYKSAKGESIMYTNGSRLAEGAQEQAELVMAAKELVDTVGKWLQDTAEMQSESMLKLTDAIRDELGQEQADQFQQSVKPTLEALYQALEASRGALTQGVSLLTGEGGAAPQEMGAEPAPEGEMEPLEGGAEMGAEMPAEPGMEAGMEAGGDEFATAPAAGGGMEDAGRPARESINRLSHSLGTILSSKKK